MSAPVAALPHRALARRAATLANRGGVEIRRRRDRFS